MTTNRSYGANWFDKKRTGTPRKWPIVLEHVYSAQLKKVHFLYPFGWYEGINVLGPAEGVPNVCEAGYVSTNSWQTEPDSPIGVWFFIGDEPMPKTCYEDVKLVETVSSAVVPIKGLPQTVYYCETITSPAYDSSKFIANFGLLSVHTPLHARFSLKEYLACHPSADNWFVHDPSAAQNILFQFGGHTFGLIPAEVSQAFSTMAEAQQFFTTNDYKVAKKIILSTWVD